MARVHSKAQVPVGSSQWLLDERHQATEFVDLEVEEFTFSARNEIEWLNEHMAEIFSQTQFEVAEVFKTPGKLRGKTPRTARKRDGGNRVPLTDVFTSNTPAAPTPSRNTPFYKNVVQFQVAEDKENQTLPSPKAPSRFSGGAGKENTDSGYHDLTEEETDNERNLRLTYNQQPTKTSPPKMALKSPAPQQVPPPTTSSTREAKSNESFFSAEEALNGKNTSDQELQRHTPQQHNTKEQTAGEPSHDPMDVDLTDSRLVSQQNGVSAETVSALGDALDQVESQPPRRRSGSVDRASSSASESSSPDRPSLRKKSSLTFASLPAREPLKPKSIGNRISRTSHLESSKPQAKTREMYLHSHGDKDGSGLNLLPGGLHMQKDAEHVEAGEEMDMDEEDAPVTSVNSEETKIHNATSTQRLHERITLLGKSNPPRPSKSIPSSLAAKQNQPRPSAPKLPSLGFGQEQRIHRNDDDEWIAPIDVQAKSDASFRETRDDTGDGISVQVLRQPQLSNRDMPQYNAPGAMSLYPVIENARANVSEEEQLEIESTTPAGSPQRPKPTDGPLSASKARLYSVLKSARGIFASSAGVSAQAKMEALTSHAPKQHAQLPSTSAEVGTEQEPSRADGQELYPNLPERADADIPLTAVREHAGAEQVTVSSRTKNQDGQESGLPKENVSAREELDKLGKKDQTSSAGAKDNATALGQSGRDYQTAAPSHGPAKPQPSSSGVLKQNEPRRPMRPTKEAPAKARPAPVSIKVRSQMVGHIGQSNASLASSVNEAIPQATSSAQPTLNKKASNSSLQTSSSTQSFKTAGTSTSTRPKALEAAARKKEQDEREAQRKADHKREMERKRAAKAEEEKKLAQEKALEQQKAAEAHSAAQRQAAERRKAEATKKNEQLKTQAAALRTQATEDLANAMLSEKSQAHQSSQRPELGMAPRPVSRAENFSASTTRQPAPHINPAKPPKRQFQAEVEPEPGSAAFSAKPASSNSQPQAKRQRISDDELADGPSRPAMAPPIRLSTMRKDNQIKLNSNYGNQASSLAGSSMLKTAVTAQHNSQHPKTPHINDLAKYSNARIPFAEAPNPPQGAASQQPSSRMQPLAKTPGTAHKSSPHYPNGDSIELPDIATDSEDSDDDEFVAPDWANSPALRELLQQQQLVDPMKVFGPIAPLSMEDVFKGNKERQAKFRARTSSANWNGPDRLTEEERKKDREARERLEKEGAWTFGNSV